MDKVISDKALKKMILEMIKEVDYDIWKSYHPKLSEDPDEAQRGLGDLLKLVKKHLKL